MVFKTTHFSMLELTEREINTIKYGLLEIIENRERYLDEVTNTAQELLDAVAPNG